MKKKIISFGVYRETLRRLSALGIIFTVIMCFLSAVQPFTVSILPGTKMIDLGGICPFFILYVFAAPIMSLAAFGWVNTRRGSDFYHSLPYSRECVYISMMSAVMSWVIGILLVSAGVGTAVCTLLLRRVTFIYSTIPVTVLSAAAACLLSACTASLAVSITGTFFSNIVVTLLIAFAPRAVISLVVSAVLDRTPYLVKQNLPLFLNNKCNILFDSITGIFTGSTGINAWKAALYTAVLGAVYFALSVILFRARRSESAGTPSARPFLQHVYRITLALFLSLPTLAEIADSGSPSVGGIIWFGVVVILYFAYELVTTKKWSNLLRAVPGLFVLAGVCVVLTVVMRFGGMAATLYEPSADEIRYVRVLSSDYGETSTHFGGQSESHYYFYAASKAQALEVEDDSINRLVAGKIAAQNKRIREGKAVWDYRDNYHSFIFAVNTGSGERYRSLGLTEGEYNAVLSAMEKNNDYRRTFLELPPAATVGVDSGNGNIIPLSEAQYDVLKREVKSFDFYTWYNSLSSLKYDEGVLNIEIITDEGEDSCIVFFPVDINILPETYRMLLDEVLFDSERTALAVKQLGEIIDADISGDEGKESYITGSSVNVTVFTGKENGSYDIMTGGYYFFFDEFTVEGKQDYEEQKEQLAKLKKIIESSDGADGVSCFIIVSMPQPDYGYRTFFIPINARYVNYFKNSEFYEKISIGEGDPEIQQ